MDTTRTLLGPVGGALAFALSLVIALPASGTPPKQLAVQGALANLGESVDGDYGMRFSLHDSAEDGAELGFEEQATVSVVDGVFSISLGATSALPLGVLLDHDALWFEVKVGAEPPLPRRPLRSSPYALVATVATDLACADGGCVSPAETTFLSGCEDGDVLKKLTGGDWGCAKDGGVPSGAIMAFDAAACPDGWAALEAARGRVVVGLDPTDSAFDSKAETGGAKTHTLTTAQMPSHNHIAMRRQLEPVDDHAGGSTAGFGLTGGGDKANTPGEYGSSFRGGGQAHNILQPYVAFLYCRKM